MKISQSIYIRLAYCSLRCRYHQYYFKKLFDKHEDNPRIHLLLVFGKNEKAVKKSMSKADFDYFKKCLKNVLFWLVLAYAILKENV